MSLAILFNFLCTQHVSDINISIIRSLRLCCWITTTGVVIQQQSRKLLMMDILMSETCWAHKKWNKIASDIKLVFYSSTIDYLVSEIKSAIRYTKVLQLCGMTLLHTPMLNVILDYEPILKNLNSSHFPYNICLYQKDEQALPGNLSRRSKKISFHITVLRFVFPDASFLFCLSVTLK